MTDKKPTYLIEGASYDTATAVQWAQKIGLFDDPKESSDLAHNQCNNGLYFIPAFSGLQAPINDNSAATAFIGITPRFGSFDFNYFVNHFICLKISVQIRHKWFGVFSNLFVLESNRCMKSF